MGKNSCQPFGLRPKSRLTASAASTVLSIRSSASSLSSTILARNAHSRHYVRDSEVALAVARTLAGARARSRGPVNEQRGTHVPLRYLPSLVVCRSDTRLRSGTALGAARTCDRTKAVRWTL